MVARAAPFLLFIGLLVVGSMMPRVIGTQAADEFVWWLAIGRGAIVAAVLLWFWPTYSDLHRRPLFSSWRECLLAVVAGLGVFFVWIYFDGDWAILSGSLGTARKGLEEVDWLRAAGRLAGFAVVVPIMEELFWRSLLLRWIAKHEFLSVRPRDVGTTAFAITTVLFALEHDRWFAGAIAGAVYNAVYMRTGNLWAAILAHAVTNGALGAWILYTHNWQYW